MGRFFPYKIVGGKTDDRIWMQYQDYYYTGDARYRICRMWWDAAASKPTIVSEVTYQTIYNLIIANSIPGTSPTNLELIGTRDTTLFFKYTANSHDYIAEIGGVNWVWIRRVDAQVEWITVVEPPPPADPYEVYTYREIFILDGSGTFMWGTCRDEVDLNIVVFGKFYTTTYDDITDADGAISRRYRITSYRRSIYSYGGQWHDVSGDSSGCLAVMINEPNDPCDSSDFATMKFASNFDIEIVTKNAREHYLGMHCDRLHTTEYVGAETMNVAGTVGGRMFSVHRSGRFYNDAWGNINCMVEWDPSTFQAERFCKLGNGLSTTPFQNSEIEAAITMTGLSASEPANINIAENCTVIGIGASSTPTGPLIYTTMRYNYREDSVLSTLGADYRDWGPEAPCTAIPGVRSDWCPASGYFIERRVWPQGMDQNEISLSLNANEIKPAQYPLAGRPWWLIDMVTAPWYLYVLMSSGDSDDRAEQWIMKIDHTDFSVEDQYLINSPPETWENHRYARSIAGNDQYIYLLMTGQSTSSQAAIWVINPSNWNLIAKVDITDPTNPSRLWRIASDGSDNTLYSLYVDRDTGLWIQRRRILAGDPPEYTFGLEAGINLNTIYPWALLPLEVGVSWDPRLWAFSGDGDALYIAGLDCIYGTNAMILYEIDPSTFSLVRWTYLCVPYEIISQRIDAKIISFW